MCENGFMFANSDAWFLNSLIVLNKWVDMKEIIVAGDVLNHAIFGQEEIDHALEKLIPAGYVEYKKIRVTEKTKKPENYSAYEELVPAGYTDRKYRATEKAMELANCSAYRRAGLFTQTEVILKRLNKPYRSK